jgi:lantibiotic modifying enzyme
VRIVERAATFGERLGGAFAPDADADPAVARARLERWRQLVARGDAERFARRLAWDGLDEAAALRGVGEVRLARGARLPAWAAVVGEASAAAPALTPAALAAEPLLEVEPRLPFGELALPFVLAGRRRLAAAAGVHHALLEARAHLQFERALLRALADYAERALHAARAAWRGGRGEADGAPEAFVAAALAGGLREVFGRYPVLARLLAERTLAWVEAAAELLARLTADRGALAAAFGGGGDPGPVADARAGLSDPHAGGRTVAILRFACGTTAVYKPRPLAAERAFAALVDWLNAAGGEPALRPLRVLDRGGYGWTEYVAHADCADPAAVERHRVRAGKLLCLMYLLSGQDLHHENLIAVGEHPVLIDLEVLLRAATRDEGVGEPVQARFWDGMQHSVMAAGLLPQLHGRPDGSTFAGGGFVASDLDPGRANVATLAGAPAPGDPAAPVERGFRDMFRTLQKRRAELLAPGGPLEAFRANRVRVILRSTSVYGSLLQRTLTPRFLECGVERSVEIDVLVRPALRRPERPRLWPAFRDEAAALHGMDVPSFHMGVGATALPTAAGEVPDFAEEPGLARAAARLAALDAAERERQAHCVRVAFTGHRLRREWAERARAAGAAPSAPAAEALGAAREVARWLESLAVRGAGGPAWLALHDGAAELVGPGLAHGRAGIGLFLAALAAVGGEARHRRLALETLAPLAAAAGDPRALARLRAKLGLGAAAGIGGVAYGLLRAGTLLDEPPLVEAARRAAAAVTRRAAAAAGEPDVFSGAAGALLALLAVHEATGDALALERAGDCARRLLAARAADPATGLRAWPRADGRLGTGFGHGAAGIAYALLRLHGHTAEPALAEAAAEAHAFEATLYREELGNWLDHAGQRGAAPAADLLCAWCHGAAGVGLGRAAAPGALAGPGARADLERALAAAARAKPGGPATLCCGGMGRAELLLSAGRALGRPELAERARELGREVAQGAARRGTFGHATLDSAFTPGLFQGASGIGYQLLRLHHPDRLPSVLLWE